MVLAPVIAPFQEGRGRSSLFRPGGLVRLHGLFSITAIEFLSDHTRPGALIQAVWGDPKASRV